jgi:hypothetical protein
MLKSPLPLQARTCPHTHNPVMTCGDFQSLTNLCCMGLCSKSSGQQLSVCPCWMAVITSNTCKSQIYGDFFKLEPSVSNVNNVMYWRSMAILTELCVHTASSKQHSIYSGEMCAVHDTTSKHNHLKQPSDCRKHGHTGKVQDTVFMQSKYSSLTSVSEFRNS